MSEKTKAEQYIPYGKRWERMMLRKKKAEIIAMYKSECKRSDGLSVKIALDQHQFEEALGLILLHYRSIIEHYLNEIDRKMMEYQQENLFMTIFDQIGEDVYELRKLIENDKYPDGWVDVDDYMPEVEELVWLTNGKGFTTLGCWMWTDKEADQWCWCDASNQLIYQAGDEIVSDCVADDLDVRYWHPVPNVKEV